MKKKKKSGVGRVALIVLCIVLGLILVAGTAVTVYISYLSGLIGRDDGVQETLSQNEIEEILKEETIAPDASTAPVMKEEDVDWGEKEGEVIEKSAEIINILLIGQDARKGQGRCRSDTMILVTCNLDNNTITLTSFLRDLYVKIPGYQDNRLNATYILGGMPLLNQALEQNFGVQVDGNVEVDFSHFAEVINLLGGVDLELRGDEAGYVNKSTGRYELAAGMMHLDGEQALVYSRIRSLDADADFSRTNRQRKVINALIEKFRNTPMDDMLKLLPKLLPMITTDLSNQEIGALAVKLLPMLAECRVISQRIPADGAYQLSTIREMSCVVADMDAARKLLEETLGG